jgi:uncharacterized protein YyaL (SSP411 family)
MNRVSDSKVSLQAINVPVNYFWSEEAFRKATTSNDDFIRHPITKFSSAVF